MHTIRPPPTADPPAPTPKNIAFFHPCHHAVFLILPAYDRVDQDQFPNALYRETAVAACRIAAHNIDGFVSTSDDPLQPAISSEFIMVPDDVKRLIIYYHVSATARVDYPICRKFSDWQFPHNEFPGYEG
jgi:hypothetical protein